jgi:2-aminoadipate transaminase
MWSQMLCYRFLKKYDLDEHLKKLRKVYEKKTTLMLSQIEKNFSSKITFTRPQGGLFIWAELPVSIDAVKLLSKAVERKVAYVPGTYFCADGGHLNTLRLNFSNSSPEQIETGMNVLNDLIQSEI